MDLVIRNVRLIDGTGSAPQSYVSLEESNGAITWIGEETARPKRPRYKEVELMVENGMSSQEGPVAENPDFPGSPGRSTCEITHPLGRHSQTALKD